MREYVERRMRLLARVIMPLNRVGVKLDRDLQRELIADHRARLKSWRKRVDQHFRDHDLGEPPLGLKDGFSYKRMCELLYGKLKLDERHHASTAQVTTNRDALKALAKYDRTGTVSLLIERSELKTAEVGIQIKPDADGRVRSRFVLGGDEKSDQNEAGKESPGTGRLASRDPNLQNQHEWVRMLYVPTHPEGWIAKADYNQIEMRLIAHFSGDEVLAEALKEDAHMFILWKVDGITDLYGVAKRGWRKLLEGYRAGDPELEEMRHLQKRINYGWPYRMGAKKLENVKGVPYQIGKRALEALNTIFRRVPEWWDSLVREARASAGGSEWGCLTLPFGRRRHFLLDDVPAICNFKPTGTAAEILDDAMEILVPETPRRFPGTQVILTVHDELVFDVHPSTDVERLVAWVREVMERPVPELGGLAIPVEFKIGRNWAKKHTCRDAACAEPPNPEGAVKLGEWRRERCKR